MEKTYLRFLCVDLFERLARCDARLSELSHSGRKAPSAALPLVQGLQSRLDILKANVLQEKPWLTSLLGDTQSEANPTTAQALTFTSGIYQALGHITQLLLRVDQAHITPETHLFLRDALPEELTCKTGHYTVIPEAEGKASGGIGEGRTEVIEALNAVRLDEVQLALLSILQHNNPLAWVTLGQPVTDYLSRHEAAFHQIYRGLSLPTEVSQLIVSHALALRLFGPAYYFQSVAQGLLQVDAFFINQVEPVLFYGLRHFNFTPNQAVILHESLDKSRQDKLKPQANEPTLQDAQLAELFCAVEKVIPERLAFTSRQYERAQLLKERLAAGILFSSASVFPDAEITEKLELKETGAEDISIYDVLSMVTEYPHTPREIINAGWLHKAERGSVWLFSALQDASPFAKFDQLISLQDHLLSKSIETAEVHRVLLCTPQAV